MRWPEHPTGAQTQGRAIMAKEFDDDATDRNDADREGPEPPAEKLTAGADDEAPPSRSEKPNADYEVGYGRPPKRFQFAKGISGHPGGRTTKRMGWLELLEKVANEEVETRGPTGRRQKISLLEAALRAQLIKAANGHTPAFRAVCKEVRNLKSVGSRRMTVREYTDQEIANLSPEERGLIEEIRRQLATYISDPADGEMESDQGPLVDEDALMPVDWPPGRQEDA